MNHGKCWSSAALSEFRAPFLTEAGRSVNRKVQGSNPWSGPNLNSIPAVSNRGRSPSGGGTRQVTRTHALISDQGPQPTALIAATMNV